MLRIKLYYYKVSLHKYTNSYYYSTFSSIQKCTIISLSTNAIIITRGMKKGTENVTKIFIRARSPSPTNLPPTQRFGLIPRNDNRLGSTLLPGTNPNVRGYAHYTIINPDPKNTNSQAVINNKPVGNKKIQHPEINRKICDVPECKDKICTHKPCSNIIQDQSIAHATHGVPILEHGKIISGGAPDLSGANKQQNFVIYNQPHETTINQEQKEPHTTNLKSNVNILDKIKENAK